MDKYSILRDMAYGIGKDYKQAEEAFNDALNNEWERIKWFGIKKEMILTGNPEFYEIATEEKLLYELSKRFSGGYKKSKKRS
jgi:hypothetical protein